MKDELWTRVDDYLEQSCRLADAALANALERSAAAGLPAIAVSACQGMLLHLLATASRAERILEIGTLGGYSTIWLARALGATGRLFSLEVNPKHAQVAQENVKFAGLAEKVEIRVGAALTLLPEMAASGESYDFFFVDADKENIAAYFDWCIRLARPGATIIVDNVIRDGQVADATSTDPRVQGVRRFLESLPSAPGIKATAIQTVGAKGYDGFAVAVVDR